MAKVKYRIREYTPKENMPGTHGYYAQAVIDNIITNKELAKKVEARTGMRAYEVLTALSAVAEIILEETAENNRIQLESDGGGGSGVSYADRLVSEKYDHRAGYRNEIDAKVAACDEALKAIGRSIHGDKGKLQRLIRMVEDYKKSIKPKYIQLELF